MLIYSSLVDGKKTCHACKKKSDALQPCTRCHFFCYCNEVREMMYEELSLVFANNLIWIVLPKGRDPQRSQ